MANYMDILESIRNSSANPAQQGRRLANFSRRFLMTDRVWRSQFEQVVSYAEWSGQNDLVSSNSGIDLVGKFTHNRGFAAIHCRCYNEDHRIQKSDLDQFISAASKEPFTQFILDHQTPLSDLAKFISDASKVPFTQLIFIDTTAHAWEKDAEATVAGRTNFQRIRLDDFRKSRIDWEDFNSKFETETPIKLLPPKSIRPHQQEAVTNVIKGFSQSNRGKLIMACGTGKTFTSIKIAEEIVGSDGIVLVLVPSLKVMSQTIREWHNDSEIPIKSFAVCSDSQVSMNMHRRKAKANKIDANTDIDARDLPIPVTTDSYELPIESEVKKSNVMNVVFSTYQSISVIEEAQANGMAEFNLIICDEAHRTTGIKMPNEDVSNFVKVHDEKLIRGARRLYMTATPNIFPRKFKNKGNPRNELLASMDDEEKFGLLFHSLNFSRAAIEGLLASYKVIVAIIDQKIVSQPIHRRLPTNSNLTLDDATKIVGSYMAIQKHGDCFRDDNEPIRRVIMFCDSIISSKLFRDEFDRITGAYLESECKLDTEDSVLKCNIEHVDGTFNSKDRDKLLNWLGEKPASNSECRILSNAGCLIEGVDVPDIDAILFMHPWKSQLDAVQAVGQILRRSNEKETGYIVLPVVIPAQKKLSDALNNNKSFDTVVSVLSALQSHDYRMHAAINNHSITGNFGDLVEFIGEVSETGTKEKRTDNSNK